MMTQNYVIELLAVSEIKVGGRLRKDLGDIVSLANSISKLGLFNPILITQDKWLVAGQRRLEALKILGWSEIPVKKLPFNREDTK